MEQTNFRILDTARIPEQMDYACTDVSFISLKLIFPNAAKLLKQGAHLNALIKPQFEAGREQVGKKGIVRDPKVHVQVIENVIGYAKDSGFSAAGLDYSPITGGSGNIEFLLDLVLGEDCAKDIDIEAVVKTAHEKLEG